jgi:hypothetical protein
MTAHERMPSRSILDRLIYAVVTRGWDQNGIATYPDQLTRYNTYLSDQQRDAFALIDAKATGLLTHVSLMIAGLGLVAPLVADNDYEMGVVIAEIAVYLLIAVGCLRCLSVFHAREFAKAEADMRIIMAHELIIRRELYSLCIRASIGFTLIVFALLPVLFFWKPERHVL